MTSFFSGVSGYMRKLTTSTYDVTAGIPATAITGLTSVNGLLIAPTSAATLSIAQGRSLIISQNLTFSNTNTATINTGSGTLTFQGADTYLGRATTDTVTNKTFTSPVVNLATISGGTMNSTVIGGTAAAAASFTTVSVLTGITGVIAVEAAGSIYGYQGNHQSKSPP